LKNEKSDLEFSAMLFRSVHALQIKVGACAQFVQFLFKGHILSSKPSSKPGIRSKDRLNVAIKKGIAESVTELGNEAKAPQQAEHEVGERRNGYQMISTAAYYQTERRGLNGFGKARDWLEAKTEIDSLPEIDGMPYGEREPDR
jgi:hypothetical protein